MRVETFWRAMLVLGLALGPTACGRTARPVEPVATPAPPLPPPADFSAERAWLHLEALERLGARVPGSQAVARAREYLGGELRELGLVVSEQRARVASDSPEEITETVNLLATLPGGSPDLIALVAPYDSPPAAAGSAVSDDASGAALLLELGRALQVREPAYTILLAFVEGDALARDGGSGAPSSAGLGTRVLVAGLDGTGDLERVRLAVVFDRVAEPDLRVARDLLSSRAMREEFWAAARRQGHGASFPADAAFEAVEGGQRAFSESRMRRFVAIAASRAVTGETPPPRADPPGPDAVAASRASLGAVGSVSLDAIVAISQRLVKIDRFARSPVSAAPEATAPPDEVLRDAGVRTDAEGAAAP
jgi:hypothetical protein